MNNFVSRINTDRVIPQCLLLSIAPETYSGVGCFTFVGEFLIVLSPADLIDELGYVGYEGGTG